VTVFIMDAQTRRGARARARMPRILCRGMGTDARPHSGTRTPARTPIRHRPQVPVELLVTSTRAPSLALGFLDLGLHLGTRGMGVSMGIIRTHVLLCRKGWVIRLGRTRTSRRSLLCHVYRRCLLPKSANTPEEAEVTQIGSLYQCRNIRSRRRLLRQATKTLEALDHLLASRPSRHGRGAALRRICTSTTSL